MKRNSVSRRFQQSIQRLGISLLMFAVVSSCGKDKGETEEGDDGLLEELTFIEFASSALKAVVVAKYDTNGDDQIDTEEALKVTLIDVEGLSSITTLEDIVNFPNLTTLICRSTSISYLDISQNAELVYINANSTELGNGTRAEEVCLKTSNSVKIEYLDLGNTNVETLELSSNTSLKTLILDSAPVKSIDISNNTTIETLSISNTEITSLDLSNNTSLKQVDASSTSITSLDLSSNTSLETLNVSSTSITSLNLSDNTSLKEVDASSTSITSLDLSNNTNLETLNVSSTEITTLNLNSNTSLKEVDASSTSITSLDLSSNTSLETLNVSSTEITELNLSSNTSLKQVDASSTSITELDLSNNTSLESLNVSGSDITSLDVSSNSSLVDLAIEDCEDLTELKYDSTTQTESEWLESVDDSVKVDTSTSTPVDGLSPSINDWEDEVIQ